jgi:tetratricopeptide (TPR) repeat protein
MDDQIEEARADLNEAVEHFRATGDLQGRAVALNNLAWLDIRIGDLDAARRQLKEAVQIATTMGDWWMRVMQLATLGLTWILEGHPEAALPIYADALESADRVGAQDPYTVIGLAMCESRLGDPRRAAILHGAAIGLVERRNEQLDPIHARAVDEDQTRLRRELGTNKFDAAMEDGKRLTFEQVVLATRRQLQDR